MLWQKLAVYTTKSSYFPPEHTDRLHFSDFLIVFRFPTHNPSFSILPCLSLDSEDLEKDSEASGTKVPLDGKSLGPWMTMQSRTTTYPYQPALEINLVVSYSSLPVISNDSQVDIIFIEFYGKASSVFIIQDIKYLFLV